MKIGNNEYREKTILMNNWGYYTDFFLEKVSKENFTSIDDLDNVKTTKIVLYPKLDILEENFDKIISKPIILVLHAHQINEIKMFLPYFRDQRFVFDRKDFFEFLGIDNFTDDEIKEIAIKRDKYIIIYVFLKCFDPYHFNPSHFKAMFTDDNWMFAVPLEYFRFEVDNKKKFDAYLSKNTNPDRAIALKLLFEDLTGINLIGDIE